MRRSISRVLSSCWRSWSLLCILFMLVMIDRGLSECTSGFIERNLLERRASKISSGQQGASPNSLADDQLLLIPGMNFTCSGNITSLLLGVEIRDSNSVQADRLSVDIYRPVVNQNEQVTRYNWVRPSSIRINLQAGDFSSDGVIKYNIPMQNNISFQNGDVIGVYQGPNNRVRLYYANNIAVPTGYVCSRSFCGSQLFNGFLLLRPIINNQPDSCLNGFLSESGLRQQILQVNINRVARRPRQQRLFPDIQFTCNGLITKWIVGAQTRTGGTKMPELQIWRNDSGNTFTKISSSLLIPNETGNSNVHEYTPDPPLMFQDGDILGVYQPEDSQSQLVLYYQDNTGPVNYRQSGLVDNPLSSFTYSGTPANEYDYPLVSVEVHATSAMPTSTVPVVPSTSEIAPDMVVSTSETNPDLSSTSTAVSDVISTSFPVVPSSFTVPDITSSSSAIVNVIATSFLVVPISSTVPDITSSSSAIVDVIATSFLVVPISSTVPDITSSSSAIANVISTSFVVTDITSPAHTLPDITTVVPAVMVTQSSTVSIGSQHPQESHSVQPTSLALPKPISSSASNGPVRSLDVGALNPLADNLAFIVGAVVGSLVVVGVCVTLFVVVIVMLAVRGKRRGAYQMTDKTKGEEQSIDDDGNGEFANPVYDVRDEGDTQSTFPLTSYELYSEAGAVFGNGGVILTQLDNPIYSTNGEENYYSVAQQPEQRYETASSCEQKNGDLYSYAEFGVVVPTNDQRQHLGISERHEAGLEDTYAVLEQLQNTSKPSHNFFEEEDIYWVPGSDTSSLYQQLARNKYREIVRKQITVSDYLGSGQFGQVSRGVWRSSSGTVAVAIKSLRPEAKEDEKVKFLQEAAIMGQFHHPSIVKLHGVVTVGEPILIVIELMRHGDLRQYLHTLQPASPGEMVPSSLPQQLLGYCRQIASGMEYLSKKSFVHRDLAARNILVDDERTCKIADFGLSRDLYDDGYYVSHGGKIPIKWTAPEALNYKKYSTASDVWSFGVLMYEIWSLGHKPFEGKTNNEAVQLLETGYRLPPPPGCPRSMYKVMIECWHSESSNRPQFSRLVSRLSQPENQLLKWTDRDKSVTHPQCTMLGAPLESASDLHADLQRRYNP